VAGTAAAGNTESQPLEGFAMSPDASLEEWLAAAEAHVAREEAREIATAAAGGAETAMQPSALAGDFGEPLGEPFGAEPSGGQLLDEASFNEDFEDDDSDEDSDGDAAPAAGEDEWGLPRVRFSLQGDLAALLLADVCTSVNEAFEPDPPLGVRLHRSALHVIFVKHHSSCGTETLLQRFSLPVDGRDQRQSSSSDSHRVRT